MIQSDNAPEPAVDPVYMAIMKTARQTLTAVRENLTFCRSGFYVPEGDREYHVIVEISSTKKIVPEFVKLQAFCDRDGEISFGMCTPAGCDFLADGEPSKLYHAVIGFARHGRNSDSLWVPGPRDAFATRLKAVLNGEE